MGASTAPLNVNKAPAIPSPKASRPPGHHAQQIVYHYFGHPVCCHHSG